MYRPIQIPYLLQQEFFNNINYTENTVKPLSDFIICFWEMKSKTTDNVAVKNIIVADGCIDLVVFFDKKEIVFSGMSHTNFDFTINLPSRSFGARMIPGAFHLLTGLPASAAMDNFVHLKDINQNFDYDEFFSLPYDKAKDYFINYFFDLTKNKKANNFTNLFNHFSNNQPATANELYNYLNYSARQCQRLFEKHYGLSPKMVLSILRFQHSLKILTSEKTRPIDILNSAQYYDQSHFNNDFKRHIGITPRQLINLYKK